MKRGKGHTQKHEQYQSVLLSREMRLLRRAIARVPSGNELRRHLDDGRVWDAHTGLWLRLHTQAAA